MKTRTWLLGVATLALAAVAADARPPARGSFGDGDRGRGPGADIGEGEGDGETAAGAATSARMERHRKKRGFALARAADSDEDGGVTADEWASYIDSLGADESGVIDLDALVATLPARRDGIDHDVERLSTVFDLDEDGVVSVDDLNAIFATLDADDDGELMSCETRKRRRLRGRSRRKGAAVVVAADADESGDVSADEWAALLKSLGADDEGVISVDSVLALIPLPEGRDAWPEGFAERLARMLDRDRDGVLEIEDLQAIFLHIDRDEDGAISADELPRRRG